MRGLVVLVRRTRPVAEVLKARDGDGSFEQLVNLTAFAIFALRAVGYSRSYPAIRDAAGWIERAAELRRWLRLRREHGAVQRRR